MIQYLQWTYVPPNIIHLYGEGLFYMDMATWLTPFTPFTQEPLGRQFIPVGEFTKEWLQAMPDNY